MKTLLSLWFMFTLAQAHEPGETHAQIGPGKAVEAVDAHQGLKLSLKARETLRIQTAKLTSASIPKEALLAIQAKLAVYVHKNGWFRLTDIEDVRQGDEIVIRGAALLRVADLNAGPAKDEHESDDHD